MIYTSYFGSSLLKGGSIDRLVAISRGIPRGWKGRRYLALAPRWDMLKMSEEKYSRCYAEILAKLDPLEVAAELEGKILLCWESKAYECHRSTVSSWLRAAGIESDELLTGGSLAVGRQKASTVPLNL